MSRRTMGVAAALYLAAGMFAAAYLAGCAYFLFSKAIPDHVALDTWLRYWDSYGADPLQRKRLLAAAALAAALVFVVPLIALTTLVRQGRSLHGDARWATGTEIRRAGLL